MAAARNPPVQITRRQMRFEPDERIWMSLVLELVLVVGMGVSFHTPWSIFRKGKSMYLVFGDR
jgi:hypothetical protein